jgi:DNA adenine methylase
MARVAKPFLKWAGGKTRLVSTLLGVLPPGGPVRYHEPFLGGGAVFFGLRAAGVVQGATLADANVPLIETFTAVRDQPERLIDALTRLALGYLGRLPEERAGYYYDVRARPPIDPVERAARLIFLNHTCYNGLYRVNRTGEFNVPHGRYRHPQIFDPDELRLASGALQGVALRAEDFEAACARAESGDTVYLDPPYHPLSATSNFTGYTSGDFGWAEQQRLATTFADLTRRGVRALLSNSAHEDIRALYDGYTVREVAMSRAINSVGSRRSPIPELLIDNAAAIGRGL